MERYVGKHQKEPGHQTRDTASPVDNVRSPGDTTGLPEGFTPYNARHTGISWAIDKGVDLQKVRQRAGHGSVEVTSRYAAILDERDTSLADALEEIFDDPHPQDS
jgi:integrase